MKYSNKGGRPKSLPHKKKSYQLNIKLASMDYLILTIRANNANMSKPDYVRKAIMSSQVVGRLTPSENDLIRELTNMGNNLNQLAKRANQAGFNVVQNDYFNLATKLDDVLEMLRNGSKDNS